MQTIIKKDPENKKIIVEREFKAPKPKVWEAWTTASILEKWWGPKTWPATSKSMDFREGGYWHYYMTGPDGAQSWGWIDYEKIEAPNYFTAQDAFCNAEGIKNTDFPSTHWRAEFHEAGDNTKVIITLTFSTKEAMEKLIEMGFEEGFSDALSNLDDYFT